MARPLRPQREEHARAIPARSSGGRDLHLLRRQRCTLPGCGERFREARTLDYGSARALCHLDHLFRGPLPHVAFESSGVEDIPGVESWLECSGPCQRRLGPVRALVGVAFAAGVDSYGVAAVELGDFHEAFRGEISGGSWQVATVELVETGAGERALLQCRPKTVARTPRVRPQSHPSRSPDYVASDHLGVAGEAPRGKDHGVRSIRLSGG